MAFLKCTGVTSHCGPDNGLNNLVKQFGQDRSLQQGRYFQKGENSKKSPSFRSPYYTQSPVSSSDNLVDDFFQNEQSGKCNASTTVPFQQSSPMHHDDSFKYSKEDWTREFIASSSCRLSEPASPLPNAHEEIERIHHRHNSRSTTSHLKWTVDEFSSTQRSSLLTSDEEQLAFQRAFEQVDDGSQEYRQHRDWDKEFADHEIWEASKYKQPSSQQQPMRSTHPVPRSSSHHHMSDVKDWSEEFNKYHDLTCQEMKYISKSLENKDEWVQHIDNKQFELTSEHQGFPKEWNRLKPDGKPYGYRAIHPEYEKYNYMADNPYLQRKDVIDTNVIHTTTLADAIMALEAKTAHNPKDAKAWEQLGLKQQENERDAAAITALEKAVSLDPNCLDAWLALAVSYTNEHCRMDAFNCLEQWVAHSPKYKHILKEELGQNYADHVKRHSYITQLFLEAARTAPGKEMDADVQVGLGVLFNMSEEYDKAVDCFNAALVSKPRDYQLWNKVGATLANARDSVGAVEMYLNALEINPSFVRARYNLAISCMNMGQHPEAAGHLITVLELQRAAAALSAGEAASRVSESGAPVDAPNGTSDGIWDSLRLLMYMMSREDLAAQCDYRNLDAFRGQI